jgi:hypothetical protein
MSDKKGMNPNNRERRAARKETSEQSRKRKRLAQNATKAAALEEGRLERGKIVKVAEDKNLLRIKRRVERAAAEQERTRIGENEAVTTAEEEEEVQRLEDKITREKRMVVEELEKTERNYELRWDEFKKDSLAAKARASRRLEVLGEAIERHEKNNDALRLQRAQLWKKKATISRNTLAHQVKAKEESFENLGITEETMDPWLREMRDEQQRLLIEFDRLEKISRASKRSWSEDSMEPGSVKALAMKLKFDLEQAGLATTAATTSADMWATPFKPSAGKTAAHEAGRPIHLQTSG